jgi:hypothetical protein
MDFAKYLEVITILEEHRSGVKDVRRHKLFNRISRTIYSISRINPPTGLHNIDCRVYIDRLEQYDRGIDVPIHSKKGTSFLTKKGLEDAERKVESPVKTYIEACSNKADKAATLVNRLFS